MPFSAVWLRPRPFAWHTRLRRMYEVYFFKQSKQCAFGPIKCTLLGFLIPASALMALSYIDEARGQAGVSQKICSWDSISNWSHWEPSVAFAARCGISGMWVSNGFTGFTKNGDVFATSQVAEWPSISKWSGEIRSTMQSCCPAQRCPSQRHRFDMVLRELSTIDHWVPLCWWCIARQVCKAHSIYIKRFWITITMYSRVVMS